MEFQTHLHNRLHVQYRNLVHRQLNQVLHGLFRHHAEPVFTTFISHFFDIDSFISRSWITVVNPEKRTDFSFHFQVLQEFHSPQQSEKQFLQDRVRVRFRIRDLSKQNFQMMHNKHLIFTDNNRSTTKFVSSCKNSFWS